MNKIKVFIADDHAMLRDGLKSILRQSGDIEIVGEAGDGLEAVQMIKVVRPDVCIVDLNMPGLKGTDVVRMVKEALPKLKIVVLTMHDKEEYIYHAIKNGALGYVLKTSPSEEIIAAVRDTYRGKLFFSSEVSQEIIKNYLENRNILQPVNSKYDFLTNREQELFNLLIQGNSNRDIAEVLCISIKTVENHRTNIMRKLEVHNIVELIKYGVKLGLIDLDT